MGLLSRLRPGDKTVFILIGLLASLLTIALYWYKPWILVLLDLKATDAMFVARGASPTPPEVVIAAVDEKSINAMGRWPWSREVTARLITALKPARVAALDIVFSEPQNEEADAALSGAIRDSGNVVLGYFFRDDSTDAPDPNAVRQIKRSAIKLIDVIGDQSQGGEIIFTGIEFSGAEPNTSVIGRGAKGFGSFNIVPQDDGLYRVANLVFKYKEDIYPSLALEALRRYYKGDIVLHTALYGVDGISINEKTIPVDEQGAFSLNYYARGGSFTTISASDLITGRAGKDAIKDKLVFVGVTEKAIYDIRPTPVDALFPGVEIHATIAGNVIKDRFLIHDTRVIFFDLFMVVALPFILAVIISRTHRTYVGLIAFLALFIAIALGDFLLFSVYNLKPGAVYPVIALMVSYISGEAYRNVVVEKKSRYIKKAFSRYVSSQLVSELLKDQGRLKLGGEKRVITVIFTDIRGFTTISEKLPPEKLVTLLNEYLNPMTTIVLEEEGMLDKYIGDAIMALFNAPLSTPDHPKRACNVAVKMIAMLKDLNVKWGGLGYPHIDIGIGVNSGEAVVGNIGSELRYDYTGIGDTVNLASRLEGMNKVYGTSIVVSEFTHASVKDAFLFRELDLVRVKGKYKPVAVYELMAAGQGADAMREVSAEFGRGLTMFRARKFEEAKAVFEGIFKNHPDDAPSALYVGRCADYIAAAPPEDWDGVYVAMSK
ncbi:MAG: adenylate/guanylate cyclase domain-containing protein [Deltaproteobacteria bacterium]|nr:adenylate/guanylate cyclase domain-containing protein [Deltaproteobacteria bacterium]